MRLDKPRIEPLPEGEWDEELRPTLEPTRAIGRGKVPNVLATIARHPKLLKRWNAFGNHVLFKSTLPARDREILILRIGWLCRAAYEWGQHVIIGKRSGLNDDDIERIRSGAEAPGWSPFEAALTSAEVAHHALLCVVGLVAIALARSLPIEAAGLSGFTYVFIGAVETWHGAREGRMRRELAGGAADVPH